MDWAGEGNQSSTCGRGEAYLLAHLSEKVASPTALETSMFSLLNPEWL